MESQETPGPERPRLAEERRAQIADLLRANRSVSVAEIEQRFAVSPMTARRDLAELERQGVARRTHGGAVLPGSSRHEDSFSTRLATATAAKRTLAAAAAATVEDGESLFLDSSTTSFHLARALLADDRRVTVMTNALPIVELLTADGRETIDLVVVGGQLRRISRSTVGPLAVEAVRRHWADHAFLSVKGLAPDGALTDADPLEAEVKRAMIERASRPVLLIDAEKLDRRGLSVIAPLSAIGEVLVSGTANEAVARLEGHGADVSQVSGEDGAA
ncbi:DeoR/GlpR family DNA-binding transcription regulator [Patulibacter defluvii]|uniref:DeoR/GlpR family DNA-binding transcription regulator n=1 Tax=Patulibacter defluvii TaxID=3095358 RepID=UPI002A75A8FA|nr:DeoR/GlpR family DNA-binding transcription regulator [Patulibacter sp. DM4]